MHNIIDHGDNDGLEFIADPELTALAREGIKSHLDSKAFDEAEKRMREKAK